MLVLFASSLTYVALLLTLFIVETYSSLLQMGFEGARVENRVSVHVPDGQTLEENNEDAIVTNVVEELLQSEGNEANETPSTPRAN